MMAASAPTLYSGRSTRIICLNAAATMTTPVPASCPCNWTLSSNNAALISRTLRLCALAKLCHRFQTSLAGHHDIAHGALDSVFASSLALAEADNITIKRLETVSRWFPECPHRRHAGCVRQRQGYRHLRSRAGSLQTGSKTGNCHHRPASPPGCSASSLP